MEIYIANISDTPTPRSSFADLIKHLEGMKATKQSVEDRNLILILSYSLIVIISLIGNLLVCKVLFERNSTLTTTNKLIINLAISDLLMTTLNIPFNIARFVLDNWPFGDTLCVLVPFIQSTSVHCSSISMMFIAIERFRSIITNSRRSNGSGFGKFLTSNRILFIIWFTATLFSIPHGVFNRVVTIPELNNLQRCQVVYPEPKQQFRQRLTLISFSTQYVIPILLTCICYIRISLFLWRRQIVGSVPERQRITINRRKRRRINMLILVVTVFATCWLPLNVFHLLTDYQIITYSSTFFFINHWFAMSSVCYNPFIYCWLNKDFKQRVKRLFKCSSAPGATINGGNKSGADPTDQITCQTICVASNDTNNPLPINSEML